ncbi:ATP-binding protein [uncultured Lacinutrix sp.]|uniref:PAS domain-containing sensor histidine kinase n=1 Tax=uncultured Lacinutrix sp. TaxID=574032 RepID=UPI00262E26AA|nr:ATP-binding protein [uncultured Lacinutrix sp.]
MIKNTLFKNVINDIDIGYWELYDNTSNWSAAFIKKLGYNPDDVEIKLDYFLNDLIHPDQRDAFRDNFFNLVRHYLDFKQEISIKCKNGEYKEFICITNDNLPVNVHGDSKVIFFNEKKYITNKKVKKDNFYYQESAEMTSTGSWYVDFKKQKSYWDDQTKKILEYPEDYTPSLKDSSQYYAEDHQQLAADCFFKCAMAGNPFDTEIKMLTSKGREFWAKAIGKAVYNDDNEIIGIRGVFQDIDEEKSKAITLQKTSDIIASQNSRLFNFAHIVSHNLRSHSSNLSLITQLIDDVNSIEEKLELITSIKDISESLNSTISHLNEVVTIQTQTDQNRVEVCLEMTMATVKKSISRIIRESNATINVDFSQVKCLPYIPAYMESIVLNLLTNAIKYKHPERDPVISIKTYIKDKKTYLEVSDNGIGIDMDKFGKKLFGMYKTFHYNKDAVGIGLFITKNQIESLGGQIFVESEVNKGTTFKIQF